MQILRRQRKGLNHKGLVFDGTLVFLGWFNGRTKDAIRRF